MVQAMQTRPRGWQAVAVQAVPEDVGRVLSSAKLGPERCRICVSSRLMLDGRYGESWFAAGPEQVAVVSKNSHPAHLAFSTPLSAVRGARTLRASGGGVLVLDVDGVPREVLRYDAGDAPFIGGIAQRIDRHLEPRRKALEKKWKKEPAEPKPEPELPPEPATPFEFDDLLTKQRERLCPSCTRPLPKNTKICPFCVKKSSTLLRILSFAKPYRKELTAMATLMIADMVLQLIPPQLVRVIVDHALLSPSRSGLLLVLVIAIGLIMVIHNAAGIFQARLGIWVGAHITSSIQTQTYRHLQTLSLGYYNKQSTGGLMARINGDARQLQSFLTDGIQYTFVNLLMIIGVTGMLFYMNPFLALMVLLPVPLVIGLSVFVWRKIHRRYALVWVMMSEVSTYLSDALSGVRVVKAFGKEADEMRRFDAKLYRSRDRLIDADTTWYTLAPILNFLVQSSMLLVWYFGGWDVYGGRITLGQLMAYMGYLGMLFGPLQLLTRLNDWLSHSLTAAARVFEVLDSEPEIHDSPHARAMPEAQGRLELRRVTFGYEKHKTVIKDLSLEIRPGQMVGLVGSSGAGKSTLINLIGRLYDVEEGQILLDGVDLREIRVADLRRHIGFVLQETFLFGGTILENIGYARPAASREEIVRAAVAANAHGFIMNMADGYDTVVGERGQKLSGGERQRIAIARALLHNPKILILDEATSSVDTETEAKIQAALATLVKGRTTIAIAHRLSTLRHADRLVVIKEGRLAEQGSHADLMAKEGGIYRKLVEIQTEWSRTIALGSTP